LSALAAGAIGLAFSWSSLLVAHGEDKEIPVPVSINALMVTLIDHSAHYIWDYSSLEREISDDEWRTLNIMRFSWQAPDR